MINTARLWHMFLNSIALSFAAKGKSRVWDMYVKGGL